MLLLQQTAEVCAMCLKACVRTVSVAHKHTLKFFKCIFNVVNVKITECFKGVSGDYRAFHEGFRCA